MLLQSYVCGQYGSGYGVELEISVSIRTGNPGLCTTSWGSSIFYLIQLTLNHDVWEPDQSGSKTNTDIVKQQCIECDSYDFSLPSHMAPGGYMSSNTMLSRRARQLQYTVTINPDSLIELQSWSRHAHHWCQIHNLFMQHITSRTTIKYVCLMHHFSRPGAVFI